MRTLSFTRMILNTALTAKRKPLSGGQGHLNPKAEE